VIGCCDLTGKSVKASKRRKIAGKVFNWLSRVLLGLPYDDIQPGIKGFTRNSATLLFSKQRLIGFSFDVELIYLARKYGFSIREIPALVEDFRQHKASKINLFSDYLTMLFDLLESRMNDRRGKYEL
jgi:dolichyl-phosphate beta-glucosyltransferase